MKGKKTDAERQQNMFQHKIRVKSKIQIFDEEVIIFKIKEQPEIKDKPGEQPDSVQKFCPCIICLCKICLGKGKKPAQKIVEQNARYDDGQIIDVKVAIEP